MTITCWVLILDRFVAPSFAPHLLKREIDAKTFTERHKKYLGRLKSQHAPAQVTPIAGACHNRCRVILRCSQRLGRQISDSFGGHHVAAHTFSQQADRALLHSGRAIHDDPQTSHSGIGNSTSSQPIDDVRPRCNHAGGWAGDGSRAQYLVGGCARGWSPSSVG